MMKKMNRLLCWLNKDRHFRWLLFVADLASIAMCAVWLAVLMRVLAVII